MGQTDVPPAASERRSGWAATAVIANQLRYQESRFTWLARGLAFILAGYLLLDRAFAWIHVPGTPLFVGEMMLVLGLYVAFRSRSAPRFIRLSPPMQILVAFMGFGFLLMAIGATEHDPLDAVRDAAIFYYGLFAIVVGSLLRAWEPAYQFFLRNYLRIIPAFLVIGLIRLFMANSQTGFLIPDSDVFITSHKPGNIGVQAAILVTFLLLVVAPSSERRDQVRNVSLTAGGLVLLAAAGTQNRGTLVAGFAAMFIVYFMGRASRPVIGKVLVVMMAAVRG